MIKYILINTLLATPILFGNAMADPLAPTVIPYVNNGTYTDGGTQTIVIKDGALSSYTVGGVTYRVFSGTLSEIDHSTTNTEYTGNIDTNYGPTLSFDYLIYKQSDINSFTVTIENEYKNFTQIAGS